MTTHAEEAAQQKLWKPKPGVASLRAYDQLLDNEFRPPQEHRAWQSRELRIVVQAATAYTPYYTELFARLGLRAADIGAAEDLAKLPVQAKDDVIEARDKLRARALPQGEKIYGIMQSSGTVGRPVQVWHTVSSVSMFGVLRQRAARWHRLDPLATRLDARSPANVARMPDGSLNPDGNVIRVPGWRFLGHVFETGPEYAFNISNPIEQQLAWLRELRPRYVMSYPGTFEEWMLAAGGRPPIDCMAALIGAGAQLTPSLRKRLEEVYLLPIHQSYGLNEIGIVACRCDAGRYHVHAEHCIVEIVDSEGRACPPGQTGRLLVTGLRNLAMPLIRYDTGDLAEAVGGPCPCGRTLPSFGEIAGRFRRYAGLPEGTRNCFRAIRRVIEVYPPQELAFLRRSQVHQDRQNRFTLRLRTVSPVPEAFRQAVMRSWEQAHAAAGNPPPPLSIVEVDEIQSSPGGKLLDFISDFHSDPVVGGPIPG